MELSFKYSREEWIEARKDYLKLKKIVNIFQALILLIITIFIVGYIVILGVNLLNTIVLVLDVLLIIVTIYIYYIQPVHIFNATKKYHEEYKLLFLDNEIKFETKEIKSSLSWNTYDSYLENEKYIFLLQGKINYVMIPKRIFNAETEKDFKKLLNSKLNIYKN